MTGKPTQDELRIQRNLVQYHKAQVRYHRRAWEEENGKLEIMERFGEKKREAPRENGLPSVKQQMDALRKLKKEAKA